MTSARWPRYGAALLGLIWYLHLGGGRTLNPVNVDWLLAGDWQQHWLGWLFFRREPWTFPLGSLPSLPYPIGSNIAFTDSNPLVAILLKPFSGWMPAEFQFIGPWLAFCFVMQGYMGAALASTVTKDPGQQLLGGYLFALSPVLSARLGHDTLCAHWLLLGLLYVGLREYDGPQGVGRGVWMAVAFAAISAAIHPYLTAMCWVLAHASYLRMWRARLITGRRLIVLAVVTTGVMLAIMGGIGYFGEAGGGAPGFGTYQADLLTLFDPQTYSQLLPYHRWTGGQWEGMGFLGLGGLFALALALVALVRTRPSLRAGVWIVALACLLLGIYALSNNVMLAGENVAQLRFYRRIAFLTQPFRASGRFIWSLHYLVLLGGLWGATRALGASRQSATTALLAVAVVLQAADYRVEPTLFADKHFRQAPAEALAVAKGRYRHTAIYPAQILGVCGVPYEQDHVFRFGLEAYRLNTTFNSGIFARVPFLRSQQECGDFFRRVDRGQLDPQTVYIVSLPSLPRFKELGASCGRFDGDWLCVSRDSDETIKTYLETGRLK